MNEKIKQHDMRDCGAACLASIAAHYNLGLPISLIRQYASTDKNGTNVLGLIKAAEKIGFTAKGVKGKSNVLPMIPTPTIAHVIRKSALGELHHYVVIHKVSKEHIEIMDPGVGEFVKMPISRFCEEWSGVLVLIEPNDNFIEGNHNISIWQRFKELLIPHKFIFIQAIIGAIVYTILGLSSSFYIEKITDNVLISGNTRLLNLLGVLMILILLLQIFINVVQKMMVVRTGQLMDSKLILGYYRHLMRLPQKFFDTMRIGEITSRINDAANIRNFINDTSINLVVNFFIVLFSFILMFTYYWKLALIMLISIPLYIVIYIISDKLNKKVERKLMEESAVLESQIVESLNSIRTIKQFGTEKYSDEKTENRFIKMMYTVYESAKNSIFSTTSSDFINRLFTIILLWVGSYYVLENQITAGELMSFYALIGYITSPLSQLISINKSIQSAFIAADRLFEIMDLNQEDSEKNVILAKDKIGNISFENVSFAYGTRKQVFENLTMSIKKGKVTAIVGESGSGKTTLASLLLNLYPIEKGKIKIGEYDLKYISNESLRSTIATVPQQITLFSGSISQNIAIGEYEPNMEKILEVSQKVGILEFIEKLPNGFETQVGENGALLSGGEKQRIAIARALYQNPEVLIMDEATSALDSISEQTIQKVIDTLREEGKTIIIIAHRLSTIKNADEIFVLGNGTLLENGGFKELIEKKGAFNHLWEMQTMV